MAKSQNNEKTKKNVKVKEENKKTTTNDNEFYTIGRLTKDPELRETTNGKKYVNITLAVNDKNPKYLYYTLWEEKAEDLCNTAKKGSNICLKGHSVGKKSDIVREDKTYTIFYNEDRIDEYLSLENSKEKSNEEEIVADKSTEMVK